MKTIPVWVVRCLVLACLSPLSALAASEEGVAVAVLYDTSGSMLDPVRDQAGRMTPKHIIARRALESIAKQLQRFATNTVAGPRKMQAGLYCFGSEKVSEFVPFGPFDTRSLSAWTRNLPQPRGSTPLGEALRTGTQAVLRSGLARRHVLIITDGMNTHGPEPAVVFPQLKQEAERQQVGFSVHFIAFDVEAKLFDPLKKLGATVVGAADEAQLNTQIDFILQKKILLEDEEPPTQRKTN
jgi:hypothetical protein